MRSSSAARDVIVESEVTSRAYYEQRLQRPTFPGLQSGVTVAIGYDCGQASAAKIRADWTGRIPAPMVAALERSAGVKGSAAAELVRQLRAVVTIPWDAAIEVFDAVDMPATESKVARALPNADKLSPDCFGAITSIAFNRGISFDLQGDRYREMRAIKAHMASGEFHLIPIEIRSMKRIWKGTTDEAGLSARREREAVLFERGLQSPAPAAGAPAAPARPAAAKPAPSKPAPGAAVPLKVAGSSPGAVAAGAAGAASAGVAAVSGGIGYGATKLGINPGIAIGIGFVVAIVLIAFFLAKKG